MSSMIGQLAVVALLAWLVQLALAYRQARLFYKRMSSLRKLGRCATGLAGGRYRGRVYVVLVVDPRTRKVIVAEKLGGATVLTSLKTVTQLEGRTLNELVDPEAPPLEGVSPRVQEAARSAAVTLQQSFNEAPVRA